MFESYSTSHLAEDRWLRSHGLEHWPDEQELARLVLGLKDEIAALADALGLAPTRDIHGQWAFEPTGQEERADMRAHREERYRAAM